MLGADVKPATSGSKTLKDATNMRAIQDSRINNPNDTHYIIGSAVGPHNMIWFQDFNRYFRRNQIPTQNRRKVA